MKKSLSIIVTLSLVLMSISGMFSVAYAEGTGTIEDPIIISTASQLTLITAGEGAKGVYYKLVNDITIENGYVGRIFYGNLIGATKENGEPVTITFDNVSVTAPNYGALYSYLYGSVENVNFAGQITTTGEKSFTASIAGKMFPGSRISNCKSTVNLSNDSNIAGGLVQMSEGGIIENCEFAGTINATLATTVNRYTAGIVATAFSNAEIVNCKNTGSVTGYQRVAGIVGYVTDNTVKIEKCANYGTVTANNSAAAGVVGYTKSSVSKCLNDGSVVALDNTDGIVYYADPTITISDCLNTGSTTAGTSISAGILGMASAAGVTVSNCINTGAISTGNATYRYPISGYKTLMTMTNNLYSIPSTSYNSNITALSGTTAVTDKEWKALKEAGELPSGFSSETWTYVEGSYELPQLIDVPVKNAKYILPDEEYKGGSGTAEDPYQISKASHFANIKNNLRSYFVLVNDITVSENLDVLFNGHLDGNGYTVTADNVAISAQESGLISKLGYNATINNLKLAGSISGTATYFGGLVGIAYAGSKISNVYSTMNITCSAPSSAGMVGRLFGGTIENCEFSGTITNTGIVQYTAGLVGNASSDSANSGVKPKIVNCVNSGSVSGYQRVGGIVAVAMDATVLIEGCANYGTVTGSDSGVGGIAGYTYSSINKCLNDGVVTGKTFVGGIVSTIPKNENITITNCLNTRDVTSTGSNLSCGIVTNGYAANSISHCLNTGNMVSANDGYRFPIGTYKNVIPVTDSYYTAPTNKAYTTSTTGVSLINPVDVAVLKAAGKLIGEFSSDVWEYTDGSAYEMPQLIGVPVKNATFTLPEPPKEDNENYNGGCGTADNPYKINNETHFANISLNPSAHFILESNLTINTPILEFSGSFDGNNKTITVSLQATGDDLGLFKVITGEAVIKNLTINGSVVGEGYNVGALVGAARGTTAQSSISNITNNANVSGVGYVGGIIGTVSVANPTGNTIISNCKNTGTIASKGSYAGGISGVNNKAITLCSNSGSIKSNSAAGGISGYAYGPISKCYNLGAVSAFDDAAGIAGEVRSKIAAISTCYNLGTVSSPDAVAFASSTAHTNGGLAVSDSYNLGAILREDDTALLVEKNAAVPDANVTISNCYYIFGNDAYGTKLASTEALNDTAITGFTKGSTFPVITDNAQTEEVSFTTINFEIVNKGVSQTSYSVSALDNNTILIPILPEEDHAGKLYVNGVAANKPDKGTIFVPAAISGETSLKIDYSLYNQIKASRNNDTLSITLISENNVFDGKVLFVICDSYGNYVKSSFIDAEKAFETTIDGLNSEYGVKILWWDSLTNVAPKCNYKYIQIAEIAEQ